MSALQGVQRIGESRWRPLELCWWPDLPELLAKGKEYPELGYKRRRRGASGHELSPENTRFKPGAVSLSHAGDHTIAFTAPHFHPAPHHCSTHTTHTTTLTAPHPVGLSPTHQSLMEGPTNPTAPAHRQRLLELPAVLLSTITSLVVEFGYGNELSLTCRAFSLTNLLHAPAFRVQLARPHCDHLLTYRVVTALQARTKQLSVVFEQLPPLDDEPFDTPSEQYMAKLTYALSTLAPMPCAAVQRCELVSGDRYDERFCPLPRSLDCTPQLAQPLLDSFPSLTALTLHRYAVACGDLVSLLSHPQLALQLQQLDLPYTTIWQPHRAGEPGELQVLTLSDQHDLQGVLQLLPGLPRLHTLQLPLATLRQQQELDALLAATQLTSLQLGHVAELHSSRSEAPCSWQRLELLSAGLASAAYLPLHSLTHTLLQGSLYTPPEASCALVAAAVHNLTQACKAPVEVGRLEVPLKGSLGLREMMAVLGPMGKCLITTVSIRPPRHSVLSAEDVPLLAPLCQKCEYLQVNGGSLIPSLHFWQQLVQLMPTVKCVNLLNLEGSATAAMAQSLRLMAGQAWARTLLIRVYPQPPVSSCCHALNREFNDPRRPAKFMVSFYNQERRLY
ncbi:hypothetical protein HaLaN_06839 [Haematococcus lacustris]|uniref:Uncharacterized protein n=1 Tax=Haematococcus lacustris TaxID=44745 RepID=A0A699YWY3_HAELA|nr:hypothetical protein HaLaN_06839 [Haematococcus lacustris]